MVKESNTRLFFKLIFYAIIIIISLGLSVILVINIYQTVQGDLSSASSLPYFVSLVSFFSFSYTLILGNSPNKVESSQIKRGLNYIVPFILLVQSITGSIELASISFTSEDISLWYTNLITSINIFLIVALVAYSIHILSVYFSKSHFSFLDILWVILTFIMIIILFTDIYIIIYNTNKASFECITRIDEYSLFIDFFYFSTVTFTTLGYGDIVPITTIAKIVVSIEALLFTIGISTVLIFVVQKASRNGIKEEAITLE